MRTHFRRGGLYGGQHGGQPLSSSSSQRLHSAHVFGGGHLTSLVGAPPPHSHRGRGKHDLRFDVRPPLHGPTAGRQFGRGGQLAPPPPPPDPQQQHFGSSSSQASDSI